MRSPRSFHYSFFTLSLPTCPREEPVHGILHLPVTETASVSDTQNWVYLPLQLSPLECLNTNRSSSFILFSFLERTMQHFKIGSCRVEINNWKALVKMSMYVTHRCASNLPFSSSLAFRSSVSRSLPSIFTSTIANSYTHEMKCVLRTEQVKLNITEKKKNKNGRFILRASNVFSY